MTEGVDKVLKGIKKENYPGEDGLTAQICLLANVVCVGFVEVIAIVRVCCCFNLDSVWVLWFSILICNYVLILTLTSW